MPKLGGIQVLRAMAAIMVLIGHVIAEAEHYFDTDIPLAALPWTRGVDVFFVISGFIITISAQRMWDQPKSAGKFLRRRVFCVVPLYYFFTTLMVLTLLIVPGGTKETQLDLSQIISSYLFLPYERYDGRIAPVLSLGWTLNYEMFFYLIVAGAMVLPRRKGLFSATALIATLGGIGLGFAPASTALAFWTNPTIIDFVFGIIIAQLFLRGYGPERGAWIVLTTGLMALIAMNTWAPAMPRFVASGVPAAIIVSAPVLFSKQRIVPRVGAILGDASYALYLSHRFVLRLASLMLVPVLPAGITGVWLYASLTTVLALVAGVATYRWVEQPMLKKLATAR